MWRRSTAAAVAAFCRRRPPPGRLADPTFTQISYHVRVPRLFCSSAAGDSGGDGFVTDSSGMGDGGEVKAAAFVDRLQLEDVLSVLQSSQERPLEQTLGDLPFDLSEEFVLRVMETPLVPGQHLVVFFRWASSQRDFHVSSRAVAALVRAIGVDCKKKDVYALWDLVKEIGETEEKGVITANVLNDLIGMLLRLCRGKAALEVYDKFEKFGCERDVDSHYLTIEALCSRKIYDEAATVSAKLLESGQLPSDDKIGKLIFSLSKGGLSKDAHLIYLAAKESGKHLHKSVLIYLIGKLCGKDETVSIAQELLEDFQGENRKRAIKPFTDVLYSLCRIKDMNGAKKLLSKMIEEGPLPGNAAFNLVVCGLSKAGDLEEAIQWMEVMERRGLRPDVYTFSVIMSGYAKGGQMEDATRIFAQAKKVHSKICRIPYHILIRGYCKLEKFDKALEIFSQMKDDGVSPNHDEYNKLIQSLCLNGMDWRTSEVLLQEMKDNGLNLIGITRGLIKAVKELEEEALSSEAAVEE